MFNPLRNPAGVLARRAFFNSRGGLMPQA